VRQTFRCSCGGRVDASSTPPAVAMDVVADVRRFHLAEGHHEVDQAEFERIRAHQRRKDRAL
jgi:hypothetical protein